jgi:hypothetical protein
MALKIAGMMIGQRSLRAAAEAHDHGLSVGLSRWPAGSWLVVNETAH